MMNFINHYLLLVSMMLSQIVSLANPEPPTITVQPSDQSVSLFADASFAVSGSSDTSVRYQWHFQNAALPNMTNSMLVLTNIQKTDAGDYSVILANSSGAVTSRVARLVITAFNGMYAFGYSWTDTRGTLPDGGVCAWTDPTRFYRNRASNGPMWPEMVAEEFELTNFPANNYAHCGATDLQIQNQVKRLRPPTKPQLPAYFLWVAGPSLNAVQYLAAITNQVLGLEFNRASVLVNSNSVNLLYLKGARSIFIHNLWGTLLPGDLQDLGANSEAARIYDRSFVPMFLEALETFARLHPDVRITFVDVATKLDDVVAHPGTYGFTKSNIGALEDPTLADKSFDGPGANYVFWNKRHGTTKLNRLIAEWTLHAINEAVLEELAVDFVDGAANIQMKHLLIGRDYTLQASTDLEDWREVLSFTSSSGTNAWNQSASSDSTYFRLRWEP